MCVPEDFEAPLTRHTSPRLHPKLCVILLLSLQDRCYDIKYIKHAFLHAASLLDNRQRCTFDFALFLLRSAPINRFFNSKEYCVWKNNFGDNLLMKKTDLDAVETFFGPMETIWNIPLFQITKLSH
ncbi:hypothetical protein FB192DRAFT_1356177 [Mucor lusitanicus]|uniref:Uncharacterized protein n=1 Tax=Mucor circinelloides f. lusitanicus TaxID=29924 RepID=A0A8H4BSS2_MUCCL|nr:hypothetical protein FB192DRAFT_1356177 [Mucor lusitanicus]